MNRIRTESTLHELVHKLGLHTMTAIFELDKPSLGIVVVKAEQLTDLIRMANATKHGTRLATKSNARMTALFESTRARPIAGRTITQLVARSRTS